MNTVHIRQGAYDDTLAPLIADLLDKIAGKAIGQAETVLIKPNLLLPAKPERAVLTHPLVVRAAAEYVLAKGARVVIGDSPAVGPFGRIWRLGGYAKALEGLNVAVAPFEQTVAVDVGRPFGQIHLARQALAADAVINIAKLKTHAQMRLTLGVKNCFGCVVGLQKPQWHMRCGVDAERFADLLVAIWQKVNPVATLIDGVLALEGDGPGLGGRPRPLGVMIAAANAAAADAAVCRMIGLDPAQLPTHRAALRRGLIADSPLIDGTVATVTGFALPVPDSLLMGPKAFHGIIRRHLLRRPQAKPGRCRSCGQCWTYCPAGAVAQAGDSVRFDYNRCIRCYCCVEVCPAGALATVAPPVARLMDLATALFKGIRKRE